MELRQYGITVHEIQPSIVRTQMLTKGVQNIEKELSLLPTGIYLDGSNSQSFAGVQNTWKDGILEGTKRATEWGETLAADPQQVVDAVVHATMSPFPCRMYLVGWSAWVTLVAQKLLPMPVFEFLHSKVLSVFSSQRSEGENSKLHSY
eukprot:Filipodium_phascolosomae@DN2624_c0_g1_i4.p1